MSRKLPTPSVLVVTDRKQIHGGLASLGAVVDAVLASGVRWISLREKDLSVDVQVDLAVELKRRAELLGAKISVHGSPEVALLAGADGVHLSEDGDAAAARALLGKHALIGQSAHTLEQITAANPDFIDYLIVGPAFPSLSKPGYGPALGEGGIRACVEAAQVPVIAVGGIDCETAGIALNAGVHGVAVMGGAMRAQSQVNLQQIILKFVGPKKNPG